MVLGLICVIVCLLDAHRLRVHVCHNILLKNPQTDAAFTILSHVSHGTGNFLEATQSSISPCTVQTGIKANQ